MIVLGISETHCATAAVLRDGAIVGCASEERFSRLKNDAGYPRLAIDALLRELTLAPSVIDRVVLAGTRIPSYDWMNRVMRDPEYVRQYYAVRLDAPRRGLGGRARKLGAKLGVLDPAPGKAPLPERERRAAVTTHLGIDGERVSIVDHHTCHAAAPHRLRLRGGAALSVRVEEARPALPGRARGDARHAVRLDRRRRPADPRRVAPRLGAAHARAPRRRAPGARRRCLHERQGEHAARRRAVGGGPLRLPVVRRRVQRGGRRVPRLRRPVRTAGDRSRAQALWPRVPRARDRRRRGRGGDAPARPRRPPPSERAGTDGGEDRRAARVGRGRRALRRAHGVRRAGARQPLDPREPVGPPRGPPDQPDDQEPRLLDAVRALGAARARGRLPGQPERARLPLHDARVPDQPEAARRDRRRDSSPRFDGARSHRGRGLEPALLPGAPRVRGAHRHRRRAQHVVQPSRRAARRFARGRRGYVRALGAPAPGPRALSHLEEDTMSEADLRYAPATQLAALIRAKKLSPVELTRAVLERIERLNPVVNAFCTVTADAALDAARAAEQAIMRGERLGPLHGIPFSIKDLHFTRGVRTMSGSFIFADRVPDVDPPFVRRLKDAGGIMVGKTTTPEFGWKAIGDSPLTGITRNPWNTAVTTAGPSAGAGAAAAAGLGPLHQGSDGAGSIRIPSGFCGIYGLKPTYGRVPT